MSALGSLVVKLALEYAEYTKGLDKSSQESLKFAQNTQNHFDKAASSSKEFFIGVVQGAASAGAAYLTVGAIIDKLKSSIDTLAELDDMAQKTGSSVENLSRLQKVASMTGAEFGKVDSAIAKMAKGMATVDDETNKTNKALAALGISSKDTAGKLRDPSEVMVDISKKLQNYQDGAGKAALATDLFGKSGADLLPYLNDVADNVDKFTGVSAQAAKEASELQDRMGLLKVKGQELWSSFASYLLPALTDFAGAMIDSKKELHGLAANTELGSWATGLVDTFVSLTNTVSNLHTQLGMVATFAAHQTVGADINAQFDRMQTGQDTTVPKADNWADAVKRNEKIEKMRAAAFKAEADLYEQTQVDLAGKIDSVWTAYEKKRADRKAQESHDNDPEVLRLKAEADAKKSNLNYTTGNLSRNADTKEKISEYEKLIRVINEKITMQELESESGRQLSDGEKIAAKFVTDLRDNKLKLIATSKMSIETQKTELAAHIEELIAKEKVEVSTKNVAKAIQALTDERENAYTAAIKEAQANEVLAETFGMTKLAIEQLEITRLQDRLSQRLSLDLSEEDVRQTERLIEVKKRSAGALIDFDQKTAAKKSLDELTAESKKFTDSLYNGLSDSLYRGFEAGKGFGKSFLDGIKNLFKTTVLKLVVQGVMGGITGSMGMSAAQAATGGPGGLLGSSPSLLSAGTTLYQGFTGAMAAAGTLGSGFMGSVAGGLMGAGAGSGLTSAAGLAIGESIAGTVGTSAATAIAGGMSTIAAALPWVAAAAAAYYVGKAAFGMGDKQSSGQTVAGNLGTDDLSRNVAWSQKGGFLRSDRSGSWNYGLSNSTAIADGKSYQDTASASSDSAMLKSLTSGYSAVKTASADYAKALGLNADSIAARTEAISFAIGKDAAETQANVTKMFADVGDKIAADLLGPFDNLKKDGESTSATLARLGSSITTANAWLSILKQRLFQVSLSGADAASKLADAFGGLQNLTAASQSFYDLYYTDGERAAQSADGMAKALASVNLAMPETKSQLRDMALSLDLNTASGRAAYVTLMQIAPEFSSVAEMMSAQAKAMADQLIATFSGGGRLVPVLNRAKLSTDALTASLADNAVAAGSISRLFLDVESGLLSFGGGVTGLKQEFTAAQLSTSYLDAEITNLRLNADKTKLDIAGLTGALASVNTETFMSVISLVFEGLASRIKGVIDGINTERIALREAAIQIINPTVMSKAAIQRGISGINTQLPSTYGVESAQFSLGMTDSFVAAAQRFLENETSTLNFWKQQVADNPKYISSGQSSAAYGVYAQQNVDGQQLNVNAQQTAVNQALAMQATALGQVKVSQLAYADALQNFTIDAGKSVSKLSKLREETLKYYDAQKQLADLMTASAAGLRGTVADYRYNQLSPEQQLNDLQSKYASAYSMALATDGADLAKYGDKLNSMLNPMLEKAKEVYGTDAAYNSFAATALARAETIAGRLETLTPTNYAADSLAMLGKIDATLVALDSASKSAEKIISDAIKAGSDKTAAGLHAVIAAITGQSIPGFANGGDFSGGWRIVGERGPELEATGAARIFTASQTRSMFSGGGSTSNADVVAELRGLRQDNANMRAELQAIAISNARLARLAEKDRVEGVLVRNDSDAPLTTVAA